MAVCFDLYCPECEYIWEDQMISNDNDGNAILPECPECREALNEEFLMKKKMGTTTFELKYDNRKDMCDWAGNTSRYWDEVKRTGGDEPDNPRKQTWE